MLSNKKRSKLISDYEMYCYKNGFEPDLFDIEAEIDMGITYSENWNLILDKIEKLTFNLDNAKKVKDLKIEQELQSNQTSTNKIIEWIKELTHESKIGLIVGSRGSGKTCLGFHYLELHNMFNPDRNIFVYNFPKPNILPKFIKNLKEFNDCPNNSIVLVDEAGLEFNQFSYLTKQSQALSNIIKIARHKDLSLIFIAQNTSTITKDLRRLVDYIMLREPSQTQIHNETPMIKRIYQNCFMLFSTKTARTKGYFIADMPRLMEYNEFDVPTFWNTDISKAYAQYEEPINTSDILNLMKELKRKL